MKLLQELTSITEALDQNSRKKELATKVANASKITNIAAISALLFGGGPNLSVSDRKKMETLGYDDAATSYEENKDFWKKCTITKTDYNFIIKQSV